MVSPRKLRLNDFRVVLPQVARGGSGSITIETHIVVVHPGPSVGAIEVEIHGSDDELLSPGSFVLESGASRAIDLVGGELRNGAVIIAASAELGVAANLVVRKSGEITSQVSISARPLASLFVIPVLYGGPESSVSNTGIAAYFQTPGTYRADLFDPDGNLVDWKGFFIPTPPTQVHVAGFLDEWFEIPDGFTQGSVVFYTVRAQPVAFATTALYSKDERLWAAQAFEIKRADYYAVSLVSKDNLAQEMEGLAEQYGLQLDSVGTSIALVVCDQEKARALERDPRVQSVLPSRFPIGFED